MDLRPAVGSNGYLYSEELEKELELLLLDPRRQEASDREGELSRYRSGSAPPTIEGSLAAVGGLFGGGGKGGGLAEFSASNSGNGFLSEEELRSDPAYLSYYYANMRLNPRLPPVMMSNEDRRSVQRLQAGSSGLGGIGDKRKVNRVDGAGMGPLFSIQSGYDSQKEDSAVESRKPQSSSEWLDNRGDDGLIGLPGLGLGDRRKSLADIIQDDLGRASPISGPPSRPASRNAFDDSVETLSTVNTQLDHLHNELVSSANAQNVAGMQSTGAVPSHAFASSLGVSLSRSTTPDPQLMARAPSPRLPPVGVKYGAIDKKSISGQGINGSSSITESANLAAAFSGMSLSINGIADEENHLPTQLQQEINGHQNILFDLQEGDQSHVKQYSHMKKSATVNLDPPYIPQSSKPSYPHLSKNNGALANQSNSPMMVNVQVEMHKPTNTTGSAINYQNADGTNSAFTGYGLGGHSINPALPSMMTNQLGAGRLHPLFENSVISSALAAPGMDSRTMGGGLPSGPNLNGAADLQSLSGVGNHAAASAYQVPLMDPLYIQYLRTAEYAAQVAAGYNEPSMDKNYMGNSYVDLLQRAYLEALLSPQKSQYAVPFPNKTGGLNHGYYGNSTFGFGMSYQESTLGSPLLSDFPVGPVSPIRHNERNMRFPSGMRNLSGGIMGSWHSDNDESFTSSLLEEFKINKTRCFELSEIAGHIVDFSADQYGSRFIQQKLETATTEEKNMVFNEIIPQALSLMTDVFGNYVIQKFFEHGSATQIRELANQLTGHVLTLSLQMYGCRVIQKAIEVVDLDQQTKMVAELDGHIMRCVRDQNGNHVIQKCIECIPQDAIEFIISSFYDQVVTLSTHPYGCRVIQRVLEHCNDLTTQRIMMDEILQNVCMLAQDQYGNYVVQHVLEHGKPHERSAIIKKLAGRIVQMSQQKFASNVVEKCLAFGDPLERQILVNEILGSTDENEPLQAMMKDQFANYVVQKVLETCDDQQREFILSRIKVHLNALKKYTYGKHIVARVEKLVAAGERRIGLQSSYPSSVA
eukprot:TRINITY_DN416_c0_g1_i1.p1 TRINITY_DN416_c0_g1~~TRINITY_DN416_c0_g1_i1.p1  ORF type:complete len:1038 (-),score=235.60 TRINITY_DN416_c0_g1_i1:607-3720(-)